MNYFIALLCLSVSNFTYASAIQTQKTPEAATLNYKIITERSHKKALFTQGLTLNKDFFYESSGLYGKSILVSYPVSEPASAWAKLSAPFTLKQTLPDHYFAEGITLLNQKLYLLTWQEGELFIYDANTLNLQKTLNYKGEGWGLTTNGTQLIRSDGSSTLYFHDAESFKALKEITVTLNHKPVDNLNELEFIDGFVWANIWHDNRILKINPDSGEVVALLDLTAITKTLNLPDAESVLNGIAYDTTQKALWITGKLWPKMFLIKVQ